MPNAQIDGLNFYYERAGTGPRLLFISGSGGDLRTQPNVFASPLAKAFDLGRKNVAGSCRTHRAESSGHHHIAGTQGGFVVEHGPCQPRSRVERMPHAILSHA